MAVHGVRIGPILTSIVGFAQDLPWAWIDGLVGLDLLRKQDFTIDYQAKIIRFRARSPFESAVEFEAESSSLIVPVRVANRDIRLGVDTAAPTIILDRTHSKGLVPLNLVSTQAEGVAGGISFGKASLRPVQLGPSKWKEVTAWVTESPLTSGQDKHGVLGLRALEIARIHFDFQNSILSWER